MNKNETQKTLKTDQSGRSESKDNFVLIEGAEKDSNYESIIEKEEGKTNRERSKDVLNNIK